MKTPKKSKTKTASDKKGPGHDKVISQRKKTSGDTRHSDRQRSGNNDPQHGSH